MCLPIFVPAAPACTRTFHFAEVICKPVSSVCTNASVFNTREWHVRRGSSVFGVSCYGIAMYVGVCEGRFVYASGIASPQVVLVVGFPPKLAVSAARAGGPRAAVLARALSSLYRQQLVQHSRVHMSRPNCAV